MNVLNKAFNGDKETFILLIDSIENDLYNIAKNKVDDYNDIDDILQETVIKIYENFGSLKHKEFFKTWSIKILLNECKKIQKSKKRDKQLIDKIIDKDTIAKNDCSIINLENDLCFKELLMNLSNIEQNIFIFHYQCKYSTKEISKILDINENTVKSKLKRSKEKIKAKYMKGGLSIYEN